MESTLLTIEGVKDVSSYGVEIEGIMGRAGVVLMVVDDKFNWDTFAQGVRDKLHKPAQPVFVRLTPSETVAVSGLFKLLKVALQKEGIDHDKVGKDQLYWFKEGKYVPFTREDAKNMSRVKSHL